MPRTGPLMLLTLLSMALAAAASAVGAPPPDPGAAHAGAGARATARPIELLVDASDAPRGIFHSRLVIPAAPGPLALAYPKWIQGEHTPTGPITELAGLTVTAQGRALPWRRD